MCTSALTNEIARVGLCVLRRRYTFLQNYYCDRRVHTVVVSA